MIERSNNFKPFILGGLSGCIGATVVMPIDTWKVRIQCCAEDQGMKLIKDICAHPIEILFYVYDQEGIRGFYNGLGSALLRQITYTTTRLGLYKTFTERFKSRHKRDMRFLEKVFASGLAGLGGALVGNPADVCLIRFQSDSTLPDHLRRHYKNSIDALVRVTREEGALTLWRGSLPTVLRAIMINIGQLSTYDQTKEILKKYREKQTMTDSLISSLTAGVVASVISLPFDNVKTKLQKMVKEPNGEFPYRGVLDCFVKSMQREKFSGLWVGLPVYFSKIAPQSIITLLAQDLLYKLF